MQALGIVHQSALADAGFRRQFRLTPEEDELFAHFVAFRRVIAPAGWGEPGRPSRPKPATRDENRVMLSVGPPGLEPGTNRL